MPVLLYAARLGGVVVSTPGLNVKNVPAGPKVFVVLALALALYVSLGPGQWSGADPLLLMGVVPLEFVVGVAMGFGVRLIFAAVEMAGEFVSFQMGFAAAAVFDPTTGASISPPTRLLYTVSVLLFLAIDGHHQVLLALASSYEYMPVGGASVGGIEAEVFLELVYGIFGSAVRLAFPFVLVMLVINLILGVIVRFVPQVNVFMIGFILTMGLGMWAMAEMMPSLGTAILAMLEHGQEVLPRLLRR